MRRIQKLLYSLLCTVMLISVIISFSLRFIPTSEPLPEPKLVEACIICQWIAWYQWVKAGGTWSGGETRPLRPSGSKPGEDDLL